MQQVLTLRARSAEQLEEDLTKQAQSLLGDSAASEDEKQLAQELLKAAGPASP